MNGRPADRPSPGKAGSTPSEGCAAWEVLAVNRILLADVIENMTDFKAVMFNVMTTFS